MRSFLVAAAVLVMLAVGVAGLVLGEGDDSPGLQGLGGLLVLGALALGVRSLRRGGLHASRGR